MGEIPYEDTWKDQCGHPVSMGDEPNQPIQGISFLSSAVVCQESRT